MMSTPSYKALSKALFLKRLMSFKFEGKSVLDQLV